MSLMMIKLTPAPRPLGAMDFSRWLLKWGSSTAVRWCAWKSRAWLAPAAIGTSLLEICALTETLVIDEEGIYDPGCYNDRLLLGFKGTMSEAELHWLRQRLLGGKLTKAEHGELRFRLPVGLVYDLANGKVVLDPDEEVQAAVRLVFALFEQYGSALAVVKHFRIHHLRFPRSALETDAKGELVWEPLRCGRVLSLLHNPFYAGAYVYGRTKTRRHALPGEAPRIKGRTRQVKREDWPIVLRDAHPGYIAWEQFAAISRCWMTIAPGDQKNDGERHVKGRPSCKGSCCVAHAGGV